MPSKQLRDDSYSEQQLSRSKRKPCLSSEQRERKRASDREAQRALREKTRNHVAHLEALVDSLQRGQSGSVDALVSQLDAQKAEIAKLRAALTSIAKITYSVRGDEPPDVDAIDTPFNSSMETSQQSRTSIDAAKGNSRSVSHSGMSNTIIHQEGPLLEENTMFSLSAVSVGHGLDAVQDTSTLELHVAELNEQATQNISIAQMAADIVRKRNLDGRFWFLAGTILNHILKHQREHPMDVSHDEDIAIRAVFEGWSSVIERYPLDRGWQWLKELDENIYFHLSHQHRLMHLRNSRLQLLHQMDPNAGWNQALPSFFAPRPSQLDIEHDPLLEHFPWPGFRERVLFSPRRFATNQFMEALRRNVHFVWPYDLHDMYIKDNHSGLYGYSAALDRQMMDIRCYTADQDFFLRFPELRQDIPQNQMTTLHKCLTIGSESPRSDDHVEEPEAAAWSDQG